MLDRPQFLYRLKVVFVFMLVKLEFIHPLLPKNFRDELPIGWNNHMFWVAFKSGGNKIYFEYYCRLQGPTSYEPKTIVSDQYQLTEQDIESFYKNGFIGPFDLLSSEEVERAREDLKNLIKTESKIYAYSKEGYKIQGEKEKDIESLSEAQKYFIDKINGYDRHLESSTLLNIFKHPAITERCSQLLGSNLILWASQIFEVSAFSKGSPWHQASTWLATDHKDSILKPEDEQELFEVTCWIAFTDATKDRSCLTIVPGSNKEIYPIKTVKKPSSKQERIYSNYGEKIDYEVDPERIKSIEVKAGQFILFCERTVHGSTNNTTNIPRLAISGRIVTPDTKIFSQKMQEEGFEIKNFNIKNIKLDNWKPILLRS